MKTADKWFMILATVASIAAGFWFGARHGRIGAVLGIVGTFSVLFVALTVFRMLRPGGGD